jgi:hypothetical protein
VLIRWWTVRSLGARPIIRARRDGGTKKQDKSAGPVLVVFNVPAPVGVHSSGPQMHVDLFPGPKCTWTSLADKGPPQLEQTITPTKSISPMIYLSANLAH